MARRPQELLDRTPPHDPDAERGVLASLLIDPRLVPGIVATLSAADLYQEHHRTLYAAIVALHSRGVAVDPTLLAGELREHGGLNAVGGVLGLVELMRAEPHPLNCEHYANRVRELSQRRQLLRLGEHCLQSGHNGKPIGDVLGVAREQLDDIGGAPSPATRAMTFPRLTCAELDGGEYETEFLVDRTLVAGQPCIIAGGKKCLKTSLLVDLAISLATAGFFLGKFRVSRAARVAMMSGESGLGTLQETARRIAYAAGRSLADIDGLIFSDMLPRFGDVLHLDALRAFLTADEIEVLIVDPAYLCLPTEGNEASLFAMGALLRSIAELCQEMGCGLILAHHTKKGVVDPFQPPELEDISWAGFQEFARQWLLVGRREKYEPGSGLHRLWLNVGGSAGHSALWALDIAEGIYDGQTPRNWDVTVSTAEEARAGVKDAQEDVKEAKRREKIERNKLALIKALAKFPAGETANVIKGACALSGGQFNLAIAELLNDGTAVNCEVPKGKWKRPFDGYKLAPDETPL